MLLVQPVASARLRAPGRHGGRRGPARLQARRGRKRGGGARGRGASEGRGFFYISSPCFRGACSGAPKLPDRLPGSVDPPRGRPRPRPPSRRAQVVRGVSGEAERMRDVPLGDLAAVPDLDASMLIHVAPKDVAPERRSPGAPAPARPGPQARVWGERGRGRGGRAAFGSGQEGAGFLDISSMAAAPRACPTWLRGWAWHDLYMKRVVNFSVYKLKEARGAQAAPGDPGIAVSWPAPRGRGGRGGPTRRPTSGTQGRHPLSARQTRFLARPRLSGTARSSRRSGTAPSAPPSSCRAGCSACTAARCGSFSTIVIWGNPEGGGQGEVGGSETGSQCKRGSARAPDPAGSCKTPLRLTRVGLH